MTDFNMRRILATAAPGDSATDWTARNLRGQRMTPTPTPMQNMAESLRAAPVAAPEVPAYTRPPVDPNTGRYLHETATRGSPGVQVGSAGQQAGRAGASVGVGTPAAGVQTGGVGAGGAGGSGVSGSVRQGVSSLRAGLSAQPGPVSKGAFLAGKVLSNPLVAGAGKLAGAAGVVANFNDYKIDDPEVDSSNTGTMNALRAGDLGMAGRSFSKGALETGMDLGSFAANTADLLVPGTGPSQAYNRMLRNHFGEQLIDRSGNNADPGVPAQAAVAPRTPNPNQTAATALRTGVNLSANPQTGDGRGPGPTSDLRTLSRDFSAELNGAKKPLPSDLREGVVHKTIDAQGRTTYSGRNVRVNSNGETQMVDGKGADLKMLNGNSNNFARSVDPLTGKANGPTVTSGMVSGSLREGSMGGDPNSEALTAAAKRGDVGALRDYYARKGEGFAGMSAQDWTAQKAAGQDEVDAPQRGEMGYAKYMARKLAREQLAVQQDHNKVLREGQANQMDVAMAPAKYAQQQRMLAGQLLQQTGGDLGAATKLAMRFGVDPSHLQSAWTADTSNRTAEQGMGLKAQDQFAKDFQSFNLDGSPNQGLTAGRQAAVRKLIPGIDGMTAEARSKHMPEAETIAKIYDRVASNPQMGMDKLITAKSPGYDSMPDWEGATLKKQSYLSGALTPGSTPNGWYITHKGVDTPLGDLSQREIEVIRHATKTGNWRGAPMKQQ